MIWLVKYQLLEIYKKFLTLIIKTNFVAKQQNLEFYFDANDICQTDAQIFTMLTLRIRIDQV